MVDLTIRPTGGLGDGESTFRPAWTV